MAPADPKLWLFLDQTLPSVKGPILLGSFVTDVQFPLDSDSSVPSSQSQPQRAKPPYLEPDDLEEPSSSTEGTIAAGTRSASTLDIAIYGLVSGSSRQVELKSQGITTHTLSSPRNVFSKIRNNPLYWGPVEELMRSNGSKPLYFVYGYKTAIDPVITRQTSKQRSHKGTVELSVAGAAAALLTLPAALPVLGNTRFGLSSENEDSSSQEMQEQGERLFAIQYWTLVRKVLSRKYSRPKPQGPPGSRNVMFHGGDSDDDDGDDDEEEVEEEDQFEWDMVECTAETFVSMNR